MIKRYLLYLILAFVLVSIILVSFAQFSFVPFSEKPQNVEDNYEYKTVTEKTVDESALSQLEQELAIAKTSGGISPERRNQIDQQITLMEAQGASVEKIKSLRDMLSELEVGGMKKTDNPDEKFTLEKETTEPNTIKNTKESNCISNTKPIFTHHITEIEKVSNIVTPPNIISGNLKTHSYVETDKQRVPVYAPVDMVLITGAHYTEGPYWFEFQVTCEIKLRFAHITEPLQKIRDVFPLTPSNDSRTQQITQQISFKAGDIIGYTTGTSQAGNWDFGVYDSTTKNKYFSSANWGTSTVYTTAVCPYDYFSPELKQKYVSLYNIRTNPKQDGESFCE